MIWDTIQTFLMILGVMKIADLFIQLAQLWKDNRPPKL